MAMNQNNNSQENDSVLQSPPSERNTTIRTMKADSNLARQSGRTIQKPTPPIIPEREEPLIISPAQKPSQEPTPEYTNIFSQTEKEIPNWAIEEAEKGALEEPAGKKAAIMTIIIFVIIIGFAILGYFLATTVLFKK